MSLASPTPVAAAAATPAAGGGGGGGGSANNNGEGGGGGSGVKPYQTGRGGSAPPNTQEEEQHQELGSPGKRSNSAGSKMMGIRVQMLDESITLFKVQVRINRVLNKEGFLFLKAKR